MASKISLKILNYLTDPVLEKGSSYTSPQSLAVFTLLYEKVWNTKKYMVNKDCAKTVGINKMLWTLTPTLWRDMSGHKKFATLLVMASLVRMKILVHHTALWMCWMYGKPEWPQVQSLLCLLLQDL